MGNVTRKCLLNQTEKDAVWFSQGSLDDSWNPTRQHFLSFSNSCIKQCFMIRQLMNRFYSNFDAQVLISGCKNIFPGFYHINWQKSPELQQKLNQLLEYIHNRRGECNWLFVFEAPLPDFPSQLWATLFKETTVWMTVKNIQQVPCECLNQFSVIGTRPLGKQEEERHHILWKSIQPSFRVCSSDYKCYCTHFQFSIQYSYFRFYRTLTNNYQNLIFRDTHDIVEYKIEEKKPVMQSFSSLYAFDPLEFVSFLLPKVLLDLIRDYDISLQLCFLPLPGKCNPHGKRV